VEGLRLVIRHPLLRPIAACSATMNLFYQMLMAVFILYITTQLELPPALVGVVLGMGSLAGLAGALVASRAAARFGTGTALIGATMISGSTTSISSACARRSRPPACADGSTPPIAAWCGHHAPRLAARSGQAVGLQPTIAIAAVGMLLAGLWVAASPVRTLRAETTARLADLA
jgi:hypothetical protein